MLFLTGAYHLLRRRLAPQRAAIAAGALLWSAIGSSPRAGGSRAPTRSPTSGIAGTYSPGCSAWSAPGPSSAVYTLFTEHTGQRVNLQHAARYSVIQRPLVHAMRAIATTFVFRPYLYLALAVLALALAAVRSGRAAATLLASALGYELALMFVAVDPELRDSQWAVAATVLAVILLTVRELARRRGAPASDPPVAAPPG